MGEEAQPSERIIPLVNLERAGGNGWAADAMKAVTAGNKITGQFRFQPVVLEKNSRPRRCKILHAHILDFKKDRATAGLTRVDEISDDFALGVNRDGAAGQVGEINAMRAAPETQVDAMMHQPFVPHSLDDAHFGEQIGGGLFEQAGATPCL